MRNRIVAFQNKLFNSAPAYPQQYAAPYYPTVGTVNPDGSWTFFTTMQQMYQSNFVNPDGSPRNNDYVSFAGYYGDDARLSLLEAAQLGMPGATTALDYLMAQPGMVDYINSASGWAIVGPS